MSIVVRSNEKPASTPPPAVVAAGAVVDEGKPHTSAPETQEEPKESSPEPEQKEASESEPEHKEESVETKPEGEVEPTQEGEKENAEEGPKKKGGFQRRIDKLNAQKAQAQQELEYWKQMALKTAGPASQTAPVEKPALPLQAEAKPHPDHFDTHAEYVEALADWKTEQKLRERDEKVARERQTEAQAKVVSSYQERVKTFSAKHSDFQEVCDDVNHIPLSVTLQSILLTSDNGPELAYELAKVPGELERISKLTPIECARAMGKFESRLNPGKTSTEEKKVTQAPKPIAPIGTGGKGSVPKSIFDPKLSQRDYEALRREQIKKRK